MFSSIVQIRNIFQSHFRHIVHEQYVGGNIVHEQYVEKDFEKYCESEQYSSFFFYILFKPAKSAVYCSLNNIAVSEQYKKKKLRYIVHEQYS